MFTHPRVLNPYCAPTSQRQPAAEPMCLTAGPRPSRGADPSSLMAGRARNLPGRREDSRELGPGKACSTCPENAAVGPDSPAAVSILGCARTPGSPPILALPCRHILARPAGSASLPRQGLLGGGVAQFAQPYSTSCSGDASSLFSATRSSLLWLRQRISLTSSSHLSFPFFHCNPQL